MMLSYDVIEWGKRLEPIERALPQPVGTEVLLRLKYCGVCHSDVHIRDGYFDLGGGNRLLMTERGIKLPTTLGHEPFGTVIAAGPDAEDVSLGVDRLVYPWTGCSGCARCRAGLDNYCMAPRMLGIQRSGGYADHLLVPHPRYLIDVGGIDPAWAATLSCSGLSTFSAVAKLKPIPPDEWVAVMGAGGLGLSAIAMLRASGHERIIAVDIDPRKLAAAEKSGAAAAIDGSDGDASKELRRLAGGSLYGAVDFVGAKATAELALDALRKGGRLVLVGLYGGMIPLSVGSTILRALTIQGSHVGSVAELKEVVALARAGELQPIPIQKRPLAEVSRTLDELKAGEIIGRVVAEM
ncbi:MAG TPA: alcohol dehydrogenase [Candidatus Binatia bacterium]|jgi:D-arabinose 1-dehydrogenase-like Zn-dependent alcohol dehydrogenase